MKNRATSITLTGHFSPGFAVASYMDFLPSLCSPPTCSHHSSAQKPSKSPSLRKSQSLTVPAGLYTPVTAASHPDAWPHLALSWLLQSSHARLLAALLTHQALFSHSPLAFAGHVMPPATAELAASLPAGVCSMSSLQRPSPDLIG